MIDRLEGWLLDWDPPLVVKVLLGPVLAVVSGACVVVGVAWCAVRFGIEERRGP